jgi:hypothetical protein
MAKKKYEELVEKYQAEINRIKDLKARAVAALQAANDCKGDWFDCERLHQAWVDADLDYQIEVDRLHQDIEVEYWDVPFDRPRKQGIEKFWELAGI